MVDYSTIITGWKKANPVSCHGLGIHDFDGEIQDLSKNAVENRIHQIKLDLEELAKIEEPYVKIKKFEYNLLISTLKTELYELESRAEYLKSPLPYIFSWYNPLSIVETSYTMRNFDTLENRIKSITKLENNIPKFLETGIKNLTGKSMARAKIMASINFISGYIDYYQDELISFVSQIDDEKLIQAWSLANEKTVNALIKFREFLKNSLERAHDNFAMGEDKFLEFLKYTEGVDVTLDHLLKIGEDDLQKNQDMLRGIAEEKFGGNLKQLLHSIENDYPAPHELLSYTEKTLERTKQYLMENEIVTIPSNYQCKAMYTPKSMRSFAFAAMNTPGPFEVPKASESYYWVTPPDPSWSEEKTAEFMKLFNKSAFESITVHEAWPGHFLQLLFSNKTGSEIAKLFAYSYAMIEGWAHYAEEMIYNHGYEPFDRSNLHVGQLLEALIRNVRFIVAIKMHCRDMTIEEAEKMFQEKSFMSETNSQIEAKRGTIDPMYLNYTLGKLMIKKLRNDYKIEKGDNFNLKEFHDELLSYGSPPISVLRKIMLKNKSSMI